MEYSTLTSCRYYSAVTLRLADLREGFTCCFLLFFFFMICVTEFGFKYRMSSFPALRFSSIEV